MVLIFSEYDAVVFATNGAVNFGKPEWVDQSEWERNGLRASELAIAFVPHIVQSILLLIKRNDAFCPEFYFRPGRVMWKGVARGRSTVGGVLFAAEGLIFRHKRQQIPDDRHSKFSNR